LDQRPPRTVFKITPGGTLATLHSFDITDGVYAEGALVQATNGTFYGTTAGGGANSYGTVFSLSVRLGPFVEREPNSGTIGTAVIILGNNLTGTTSVTFNGTAAAFTIVSSSEIKTTVPNGATTGKVKVTTPSRTLSSNANFRVT
jgi:large repetitive protein